MSAVFQVDLASDAIPFPHVWEHTVGSGRALHALRADWQLQLRRAHDEVGFRYVRFHGILSDDVGTLTRQEEALVYSFHNADVIYDALLDIGVRPFVELSFMPTAIASGSRTVFSYRANVTPPISMQDWKALIRRLAEHWIERYGREEVERWYFEVWNEPNLEDFWTGTRTEYFALYRSTARTLKDVDPDLRVGGPATAKNEWIPEFLEFCEREDLPADFVTTHHYPTDDFGAPGDDTENQLAQSKRGVLYEQVLRARKQAREKPLYYTEWNASSNSRDPLHDRSYAAAFVGKTVLDAAHIVDGYSFWTFTDIFDENYFPSLPFHGGFGLMNIHGIPKPTYRTYELLHELGTERLEVTGTHTTVDAWAVRRGSDLTLFLTNHALPRQPIAQETVRVEISGVRVSPRVSIRRVDEEHANAPTVWRRLGASDYPSRTQVDELIEASRLTTERAEAEFAEGRLVFVVQVPTHAVASVTFEGICP